VTRYQLPPDVARRRALATALVRAATSLAPVVLAIMLLRRVGWAPTIAFWSVAVALGALVAVRAVVGYGSANRRLAALSVTLDGDALRVDGIREGWSIERPLVARIVEVEGSLGGLRVERQPDPRSGVVFVASVPRGGPGYADLRAALATWHPIERRGRRGPAVRLAIGALVVAGIFFLPFVLEDFVARSRLLAAALVAGTWIAMRLALRQG
jgi:hypothetical protein